MTMTMSIHRYLMQIYNTVLSILLFPVFLVFMIAFVVVWLISTVTLIGPALQYFFVRFYDNLVLQREKLPQFADMKLLTIPDHVHSCSNNKAYTLCARYTQPAIASNYPPICISSGLGSSVVVTSKLHEELVACGFEVLSFDRLGDGFSDDNCSGRHPTAVDIVNEMEYVMSSVCSSDTKWILLGPSMGSIIAQCYIARYPQKVSGFLNMDGLPYTFGKQRALFEWASFVYNLYASVIWTGVFRPFIYAVLSRTREMFESKQFPLPYIAAQLNRERFFRNLATEMKSMVDCCQTVEAAWGDLSLFKLDKRIVEVFSAAPPTTSVEFDSYTNQRQVTTRRSESEVGLAWVEPADLEIVRQQWKLIAGSSSVAVKGSNTTMSSTSVNNNSKFSSIWPRLVVRVMSARNHDFGSMLANCFYNSEMKRYAAAEHAFNALLALNGGRTVYPSLNHSQMLAYPDEIVRHVQEIARRIVTKKE